MVMIIASRSMANVRNLRTAQPQSKNRLADEQWVKLQKIEAKFWDSYVAQLKTCLAKSRDAQVSHNLIRLEATRTSKYDTLYLKVLSPKPCVKDQGK